MILPRFELAEPASVREACDILRRNEKAKVIAGGTDLLVNMKRKVTKADPLVSLAGISELSSVAVESYACGVMIMDIPITSEKIFNALEAKKKAGVSSYVLKPSKLADKIIDQALEMNR